MPNLASRSSRLMASIVLVASACVGACLPSRYVLDLSGSDATLEESEVKLEASDRAPFSAGPRPKIVLIDVIGLLSHVPPPGLFATSANVVDSLVSRLIKAEEDHEVRAVILRVNSPGGTVAASESMFREIEAFRTRCGKPVIVSMADVAASGGYYISLAADRIIAQPATITGSVGVIFQTVNVARGLSMIGVEARAVVSARNKDLANPLTSIDEEHYAILQSIVDDFYARFCAIVTARRASIDSESMALVSDGRILTGSQALELGLIDQLGDLRDAFASAKELAGVSEARLMKYHINGRVPASPYAMSGSSAASTQLEATSDVSVQFSLSAGNLAAGFYYLWLPPQ